MSDTQDDNSDEEKSSAGVVCQDAAAALAHHCGAPAPRLRPEMERRERWKMELTCEPHMSVSHVRFMLF